MKIAVGTDMDGHVPRIVVAELRKLGHEVTEFGALLTPIAPWPSVATEVASQVAAGKFETAVLFCWTGTGISIAANKVRGIRAALCQDAETAAGARQWNDANVLAMSLRTTSEQVAKEILAAWLRTLPSTDQEDVGCLAFLEQFENEQFKK